MTYLQAILLGLTQGITEFLPISSSGHLLILKDVFDLSEIPRLFDIILHLASLVVVLVFFRKIILYYIYHLVRFFSGKRDQNAYGALKTFIMLFVASVFTALIGFQFPEIHNPKIVGGLFILTGIFFFIPHWLKKSPIESQNNIEEYETLSWKQAIITGIAQGFAVLPGVSRSGTTITTSQLVGLPNKSAGEWAFLLFIPAVLGATILDLKDANTLLGEVGVLPLLVAIVTTIFSGFLSIKLLILLVRKNKLSLFSYYLIPAGIVSLFFF